MVLAGCGVSEKRLSSAETTLGNEANLVAIGEAPSIDSAGNTLNLEGREPGAANPDNVPIKRNVYDTLSSNFSDIFVDYENVEQDVLVFPNDSLVIGDFNKDIIQQYAEVMNPETDIVSIIGCSHGGTEIENGNSLLAIGRAHRVKEAFLFSGIAHDKILDEGCWAHSTFDGVMPDRGVVLTLKRVKGS